MRRQNHFSRGAMLTTLGLFGAVLILMILIAIPVVRRARADNHAQACTLNLATLLAAKEKYALDHELKKGAKIEMDELLKGNPALLKQKPICPDGGVYTLNPEGMPPTCSIPGHRLPMLGLKRAGTPEATAVTSATATK